MRVSFASLTVTAPTLGFVNEPNATASRPASSTRCSPACRRPFREPGIQVPDPLPAGAPSRVPRFDGNPERLRVDSDAQPARPRSTSRRGAVVTGLTGSSTTGSAPTRSCRTPAAPPCRCAPAWSAGRGPRPRARSTVASFNLERFFDTIDDRGHGDPVLTPAAFAARLVKASLDHPRRPAPAGRHRRRRGREPDDAAGARGPDQQRRGRRRPAGSRLRRLPRRGQRPRWHRRRLPGEDRGGGAASRVCGVIAVVQEGLTTTYIDPNDDSSDLLNDRRRCWRIPWSHLADGARCR